MKISTLIEFALIATLIGINLLIIDPIVGTNRWAAYAASLAMFAVLFIAMDKLEVRFDFEFLRKKIDGQMGAWFVAALLLMPFFLSMVI